MADELGAVRRTPRPTGDRQTPETVAQLPRGATNAPTPVSTDAGNGTGDLRAKFLDTFLRVTRDTADGAVMAERFIAEGWRPAQPFEAPLAVHFAGPYVTIGGRRRQLCAWCGHVLLDVQLAPGQEHEPWFDVKLVRVEDGATTRQPYTYGDPLPPGCCALPDDEQPTPGPGCYPPADGWDGVAIPATCGKHVPGTSSNRCLLRPGHTGDHSDEFELPPCTCLPDCCLGEGDPPNRCEHCATIDGELPCPIADAEPDEAQETRAGADWPAEEADRG